MIKLAAISHPYHHIRQITTLLFFLLFTYTGFATQDNPFMDMAEKPYAEYYKNLQKTAYENIDLRDEAWAMQTAARLRETGRLSGNSKWELEASLFETDYRFFRTIYLQRPTQQKVDSLAEEMIVSLSSIAGQAKKIGASDIRLRALYGIVERYAYVIKNYEMAFRYCHELDKALSGVSAEEFPLKPFHYLKIAQQYNFFREYETACLYLEKVLETPDIAYNQRVLESAWNDLGLIYRDHYKDLDASDSCFNHILELNPTVPGKVPPAANQETRAFLLKEFELWTAIAKGNLGQNAYLRGEYEKAIPLLHHGMLSAKYNEYNYPYATSKALTLTEIFLKNNNLPQAEYHANVAYKLLDKEEKRHKTEIILRNSNLWAQYYQAMSRCLRMRGNYQKALLYADSTLTMRALFEDDFNLRKLHRAEQWIKMEELETEKLRSNQYRRLTLISTAFLSIILALLAMLYYLYYKKKAAYHDLVQKNKQWAIGNLLEKVADSPSSTEAAQKEVNNRQKPTEKEVELTDRIHKMMVEQEIYKDSTLTLDSLARLLDVNRETVSHAINRTTDKNFARFLNEYRIKEAVRLLSAARNHTINFDDLSEKVGFNNRTSFHRVFKQITGLPPNRFKNNR